jgi:hypothetical protein
MPKTAEIQGIYSNLVFPMYIMYLIEYHIIKHFKLTSLSTFEFLTDACLLDNMLPYWANSHFLTVTLAWPSVSRSPRQIPED